jgi:hypothetical protein
VQHEKDGGRKVADTDQKIDEIEQREQKFSTTDRGASDDNDEKQKDNNKNRFASLMKNGMEDDDSEDEEDPEGPKDGDEMSDASKVLFDTTTTPLDSPSLSSNTQQNSEDETRTTSQHKHATRQAKRERRKALLLRNKNKAPPISTQIPPPLTFENKQQDMFTMIGIKSKDDIRAEDTTPRTAREGHDSDISLQDYQNPTATSNTTTKTLISRSPKGQNSKNSPQETQLVRSTNPSKQSVSRNLRDRSALTPPTPDKKNHNLEPAGTTDTEIPGDHTLSHKGTTNSELHHSDTDNSLLAGACHNHEEKGDTKKK